jgi:hypothetical protein
MVSKTREKGPVTGERLIKRQLTGQKYRTGKAYGSVPGFPSEIYDAFSSGERYTRSQQKQAQ